MSPYSNIETLMFNHFDKNLDELCKEKTMFDDMTHYKLASYRMSSDFFDKRCEKYVFIFHNDVTNDELASTTLFDCFDYSFRENFHKELILLKKNWKDH